MLRQYVVISASATELPGRAETPSDSIRKLLQNRKGYKARQAPPKHQPKSKASPATQRKPALQLLRDDASLSAAQLLQFERNGCLTTPALLEQDALQTLGKEVTREVESRRLEALQHRVRVLCPGYDSKNISSIETALRILEEHGTEPVGFLQVFNTWRSIALVREAAEQLSKVASQLLGCKSVRLYQDCAFFKDAGFAATNWHSDLKMAPLDTSHFVTAWIPFRAMQATDDSGLAFAAGSHRDFALPFWHGVKAEDLDLKSRGYKIVQTGKMQLGDVSWHHGWTVHCGAPQPRSSQPRLALAISFFKDGTSILPAKIASARVQCEDEESWSVWVKDLKPGGLARHELLPKMRCK